MSVADGWYLSGTGMKLHLPEMKNGLPSWWALCGVRLSRFRTEDHDEHGIVHERCRKCQHMEKTS